MTILRIPTRAEQVDYVQRTALDGRDYLLHFAWNQRESKWYLDVRDQRGEPIVLGIKIVANKRLLGRLVTSEARPPGELIAVDMTSPAGSGKDAYDPGKSELGSRVVLLYLDAETIASLQAGA